MISSIVENKNILNNPKRDTIMKPLVSIITPSYNQGRFIREAIESVLGQDYENIEYIVIDGGSTDNTLEILSEYKNRLQYISEPDSGQSNAINKGFKMAKGEIVAWLNSDDIYEPGCISTIVDCFVKNSKLSLLYGEGYILDEIGNKVRIFEHTQPFDYWMLVNFWDYIMQPTTFFRACTLAEVGYLDENLEYCMDWDLWIKLASTGEVRYINDLLACSREYAATKTSTGGKRRLEEIKSIILRYSKEEHPLGIKMYSASTFYTLNGSNALSRKVYGKGLELIQRFLMNKIPSRGDNGWIGRRYSQIIPNYCASVKILIDVPIMTLLNQEITILLNDEIKGNYIISGVEENVLEIQNDGKEYSQLTLICKKCKRVLKGVSRSVGARLLRIEYL